MLHMKDLVGAWSHLVLVWPLERWNLPGWEYSVALSHTREVSVSAVCTTQLGEEMWQLIPTPSGTPTCAFFPVLSLICTSACKNCNQECDGFTEFWESYQWITEPKGAPGASQTPRCFYTEAVFMYNFYIF